MKGPHILKSSEGAENFHPSELTQLRKRKTKGMDGDRKPFSIKKSKKERKKQRKKSHQLKQNIAMMKTRMILGKNMRK